ncbi:MAG: DNA replication/repair protein RecF [Erythrobacter sp.]
MALDRISLSNFRNHQLTELADTRAFNLLIGENGAGKTNVLEALSLLAPGRGLRRAALGDMPGPHGDGAFAVGASLRESGHESARLGTFVDAEHPGRRQVRINSADASATSLGEWLAISWLTPAMDGLFLDSAGARRRYIDRLALAIDPVHGRNVSRYEAALRERNKLLETGGDTTWLDAIEAQAADHGARVAAGRVALLAELGEALSALPDEPFARPILTYRAGGAMERGALQDEFRSNRARDRAAGRTLSGPQRDDLEVIMAGTGQAAASCSTGEQKAMLIAITLAHAELAAQGRPSVLLLDEVAAHLDPVRRAALFDRLRGAGVQCWMTGTELPPFSAIESEAALWMVADGTVERQTG